MAQFSESILKVMAYFDIFNYPITLGEIRQFLDKPVNEKELQLAVRQLLDKQVIWQLGNFYSLKDDPQLEQRRLDGNLMAISHLKIAMRISRVLAWCPYIRGVGISGSLSKNFAYKGSDFDFFIITAANRLWIARTFQHLFIKIFSWLGLRRLCCLNYYIDEQALEIAERNIFTATEVATLLPARGNRAFRQFFLANQWVFDFIPNASFKQLPAKEIPLGPVKKCIEWPLNRKLGDRIDNALLKFYSRRWEALRNKGKAMPSGFILGSVLTEKHLCKPMPHHFQQNILNRFQQKIADVKQHYVVTLDKNANVS